MGAVSANNAGLFVRRALILGAILAAALIIASFILGYSRSAVSIASGSIISMASFAILVLVVTRAFGGGGAIFFAFLGLAKMCAIGIILWWLITRHHVEPIGFMAGFSVMVVSLVVEGMRLK